MEPEPFSPSVSDFAADRQAKYPRRFRAELAAEQEVLQWVIEGTRDLDHTGASRSHPKLNFRFFIENEQDADFPATNRAHDPRPFLPTHEDRSLGDYTDRVMQLTGGRRFGLVANGLQAVSASLCERMRDFLFEYQRLNGIHSMPAATVFIGNYHRTPFGAHLDTGCLDLFQFIVAGRKRIRFWSGDQLEGNPALRRALLRSPHDYGSSMPLSSALDGAAGEVLYWPGSTWHVAEALDDAPQMGITLALLPPTLSLQRIVSETIDELLAETVGVCYPQDAAPRRGESPPSRHIEETCRRVAEVFRRELRSRTTHKWMAASTSIGIEHPRIPEAPVVESDRVRGCAARLQWHAQDGELLVASLGVRSRSRTEMRGLLEELRGEQVLVVGDLVARHADKGHPAEVHGLLDHLISTGAVRRVNGP